MQGDSWIMPVSTCDCGAATSLSVQVVFECMASDDDSSGKHQSSLTSWRLRKGENSLLIKESLLDLAQPIWLMPALKGKANCLYHLSLRGLIADIRYQQGFLHFFNYLFGNLRSQRKKEGLPFLKGMACIRLILEKWHLVLWDSEVLRTTALSSWHRLGLQ